MQLGGLIANSINTGFPGGGGMIAVDDDSSIEVGTAGGATLGAITIDAGLSVAVSGTIGFIGLVAPHLMRPLIGHDPARLLIPSALTGSALLLAADIAVRIIPSTSDIKVGVLTSIIGVPFFLYLIMRERRALGGGVA